MANDNNLEQVQTFQKLYAEFRTARNVAFGLAAAKDFTRRADETNAEFLARLSTFAENHKRSNDAVDKAFEAARGAGRTLLSIVFLDIDSFRRGCQPYLIKQGYAELANVYLFTAPLDALNAIFMRSEFGGFGTTSWQTIAALNHEMEDTIYGSFLDEYMHVRDLVVAGKLASDPFPTDDMDRVRSQILAPSTHSGVLKKAIAHVQKRV